MVRCLIVDDDELARKSPEPMYQKVEGLTVVGTCENGLEALQFLKRESIDRLLNIEMPDL